MWHLQLGIKVFLLSLALTVVAIPVRAQQSGMGAMGDRSSGPARAVNPSGTGTRAPGSRPSADSMVGSSGMSSMPVTRPLGVAGLGVRSGMSGMGSLSGSQGVSSGMGGMPGGPSSGAAGTNGGTGMSGGSSGMSRFGSLADSGTRSSTGTMSGGTTPVGMGGTSVTGARTGMRGQSGSPGLGGRLGMPSGSPAAANPGSMTGMPGR